MNNKINCLLGAVILMISANSVMATTLTHNLVATQEKMSVIEGHKSPLITPYAAIKKKNESPLARALAQLPSQSTADALDAPFNVDKTLTLEVSELKDSSGLVYLGGKVSAAELSGYLDQLKNELGEEQYVIYRQHQSARDHQSFHVTLINPYEYQTLNKEKLKKLPSFRVTLHGVGRVAKGAKESYFVVTSSADGQFIRQKLLLKNKDFHVTLGFSPDDVFGVSKGRDTLIKK
jgi:hypothetical protein